MPATVEGQPWDFSHVLGLISSLSQTGPEQPQSPSSVDKRRGSPQNGNRYFEESSKNGEVDTKDFAAPSQGLGDFAKIYQYLGTPLHSPAPAVQPYYAEKTKDAIQLPSKDDYASDGATYIKSLFGGSKNVTWDEAVSAEEPVTGEASDTSVTPESPTLTKSQRKKKNRRERKAKETAAAVKAATVSESEADVVTRKKTPATKASNHMRASSPVSKYNLRPRDSTGSVVKPKSNGTNDFAASVRTAVERLESAKQANRGATAAESDVTPSKPARPRQSLARTTSHTPVSAPKSNAPTQIVSQPAPMVKWPVTPAQKQSTTQFLPSTVQPPKNAVQSFQAPAQSQTSQQTAPPKHPRVIEPMVVRSGEDRHWALFMKLISGFWQDRSYLINPMNLTTHNNDPKGIHVFVDASNIFIGFNDQLKRSRGIPPWTQVPPVGLSFDALALLMERRRPVAKRVLAGSNPWLAAFDKAKAVGYQCSILEKVYKARELTERQIFFREQDQLMGRGRAKAPPANSVATANGGSNGNGSGSETNAPQYARPAMIEQGVDEILHLKILESIVDTEVPATIVLATGDAAQAEYSQGFMAMAERALKKGWTVELVSWSKNISMMYTRKAWRDAWGERFKVIFLDDYAEELLAM